MTSEHTPETDDGGVSRRGFLARGVATGLVAGGFTTVTLAQMVEEVQTYVLDGRVEAWQGVAPAAISGEDNPTLNLEGGQTYRLIWRNIDGQPHNFAIQDAQGDNLEVLRPLQITSDQVTVFDNATTGNVTNLTWADAVTEEAAQLNETATNATNATAGGGGGLVPVTNIVSEEGAVQAVEFTAGPEMSNYICTIHPTTMVGDVSITGAAANATDGAGNATNDTA